MEKSKIHKFVKRLLYQTAGTFNRYIEEIVESHLLPYFGTIKIQQDIARPHISSVTLDSL